MSRGATLNSSMHADAGKEATLSYTVGFAGLYQLDPDPWTPHAKPGKDVRGMDILFPDEYTTFENALPTPWKAWGFSSINLEKTLDPDEAYRDFMKFLLDDSPVQQLRMSEQDGIITTDYSRLDLTPPKAERLSATLKVQTMEMYLAGFWKAWGFSSINLEKTLDPDEAYRDFMKFLLDDSPVQQLRMSEQDGIITTDYSRLDLTPPKAERLSATLKVQTMEMYLAGF